MNEKITSDEISGFYIHSTWGDGLHRFDRGEFLEAGNFLEIRQAFPWVVSVGLNVGMPKDSVFSDGLSLGDSIYPKHNALTDSGFKPFVVPVGEEKSSLIMLVKSGHGLSGADIGSVLVGTAVKTVEIIS